MQLGVAITRVNNALLIAQDFLHPNALYVFDKTFTLIFLFGIGNKSMQWEKLGMGL